MYVGVAVLGVSVLLAPFGGPSVPTLLLADSAPAAVAQATAKALPASAPRPASGGKTYTVAKGETLYAISKKTLGKGGRWKEIAQLNGLPEGKVFAGQVLKLPSK